MQLLILGADNSKEMEEISAELSAEKFKIIESDENFKILSHLLKHYEIPIVIDADAINCLAENDRDILKRTRCHVVLTPHAKEMERLSGVSMGEILAALAAIEQE